MSQSEPETGTIGPELKRELDEGPTWTYAWQLAPGVVTPVHRPFLPALYGSCERLIEGPVREALREAGAGATGIDIACNEGWFGHRLLDWGARRVVAVDSRRANIRRARMLRDHFGIEPDRLELIEADLFDLDPDRLGRFDVVTLLGILYHLENPMGAMRLSRALTKSLCVIESQVADPEVSFERVGEASERGDQAPGLILHREADQISPLAAMPGILSLVPNRAAIVEMALAAGFGSAEIVEPEPEDRELRRERAIVLARC